MKRQEFTAKIKVAAFERAQGRCECCNVFLRSGNIEYDHHIPCALGGEPTLENCECLCRNCHGAKTAQEDVPRIAKAKRVAAHHIGAKRPKATLAGSKNSKWKKPINGPAVRRDT